MTIICADPSPISLLRLDHLVKKAMPHSTIHLCKSAECAETIARERGCDVLITEIDFGRKKGEGIELAGKLQELIPAVNVIFETAAPIRDYAALIMKMKYSGYLTKPFGSEEIQRELHELRYQKHELDA